MKSGNFMINGADQNDLINSFQALFQPDYSYESTNGIIFLRDSYYLRTKSNLVSFIILDFLEPDLCHVEIGVGGGKIGLILKCSWASEDKELRKVLKKVESICEKNNWEIINAE